MKGTKLCIATALYEIINGLHGVRSEQHTKWEKEAKAYLKRLTLNKNISINPDTKTITIENAGGTRILHTIQIN